MNKPLLLFFILIISSTIVTAEEDDFADDSSGQATTLGFEFNGFLEFEQGLNITGKGPLRDGASNDDANWVMANRRFRLQTTKTNDRGGIYGKLDFIRDDFSNETYVDIRELRLQYKITNWLDISAGKQVSTWGVADMLFINDLFPKNWKANFLGRDMESMKESSTSLRATSYFYNYIFDVVYTPKFSPDTTPTGCQLSVYDPNTGRPIANSSSCGIDNASNLANPETNSHRDGEIAASFKKRIGMQELALYGYHGYYKNPKGLSYDGSTYYPHHPSLSVVGASSEGQIGPGILTAEAGYYYSHQDKKGTDPLIENSTLKYLLGYRIDLSANFSLGFQVYQEKMMKYDQYAASIGFSPTAKKEAQETYTIRATYKAQQETLRFNLFSYIRPDDHDGLIKFDISKRLDDNFSISTGVNIFYGKEGYLDRDFGMLKSDDNFFFRIRYDI